MPAYDGFAQPASAPCAIMVMLGRRDLSCGLIVFHGLGLLFLAE